MTIIGISFFRKNCIFRHLVTRQILAKIPFQIEAGDWKRSVQVYPIHQAMFRVIKESETVDERGHCFLLQTVGRESRYFSMETRADLLRLESAWHRAVCQAVSSLKSTTFHVVYKNVPGALTLDWTDGFLLKPFASPTYAFTYSFSQLKGSSDDGNATLTLNFQDPVGSNNFVEQVSSDNIRYLRRD